MFTNYILGAVMLITLRILMVKAVLRRKRKFFTVTAGSGESQRLVIPVRTLVILGSGGHTTEMFRLLKYLTPDRYLPKVFVLAETDYQSLSKLNAYKRSQAKLEGRDQVCNNESDDNSNLSITNSDVDVNYKIHKIPRSREVNQTYLTCIIPGLKALVRSFQLLWQEKPDLIISNGPGTCVPICIAALIFQIIGLTNLQTITYIESICRTETLSLTGKILYYISDMFFVQWDTLKQKYPRSIYIGRLI